MRPGSPLSPQDQARVGLDLRGGIVATSLAPAGAETQRGDGLCGMRIRPAYDTGKVMASVSFGQ